MFIIRPKSGLTISGYFLELKLSLLANPEPGARLPWRPGQIPISDTLPGEQQGQTCHKFRAVRSKSAAFIPVSHADTSLHELIADFDLVIGAVPGCMGYETLKTIIECGKDTDKDC